MQVANYKLGAVMFIAISFSTAGPVLASTGRPALPLPTLVKDHSPGTDHIKTDLIKNLRNIVRSSVANL